jgi:hypothetical protein
MPEPLPEGRKTGQETVVGQSDQLPLKLLFEVIEKMVDETGVESATSSLRTMRESS